MVIEVNDNPKVKLPFSIDSGLITVSDEVVILKDLQGYYSLWLDCGTQFNNLFIKLEHKNGYYVSEVIDILQTNLEIIRGKINEVGRHFLDIQDVLQLINVSDMNKFIVNKYATEPEIYQQFSHLIELDSRKLYTPIVPKLYKLLFLSTDIKYEEVIINKQPIDIFNILFRKLKELNAKRDNEIKIQQADSIIPIVKTNMFLMNHYFQPELLRVNVIYVFKDKLTNKFILTVKIDSVLAINVKKQVLEKEYLNIYGDEWKTIKNIKDDYEDKINMFKSAVENLYVEIGITNNYLVITNNTISISEYTTSDYELIQEYEINAIHDVMELIKEYK